MSGSGSSDGWLVTEDSAINTEPCGHMTSFKVTEKVFDEQTPYQKLEVYKTNKWGHLMVLDGVFQNTEVDEFAYHEMQAHVPLFAHPHPEHVLIIGGGDGGVAREALRHKSVKHVTLVDIDARVSEAARRFFPRIAEGLREDPRLDLRHEDGAKFVANPELDGRFDVIVVDSSDPVGPNQALFRKEFYVRLHQLLKPQGLVVTQGENFWLHPHVIKSTTELSATVFDHVDYYWFSIPVYPCGIIGCVTMVKGKELDITKPCRADTDNMPLLYYTPQIHTAAFAKPAFFAKGFNPFDLVKSA